MASLRRPKLCWGRGIKPVACCPPGFPLPSLLPPASGGSGRGGGSSGRGRDGNLVSGKGGGGRGGGAVVARGKSQSKERLAPQRCSVPGSPGTHRTPKRWSRCSQKAAPEGARARTGTGEPRGRTGEEGEQGGGQGREPGAGGGCRERRERRAGRGGFWHAGRGRGGHGGRERPGGEAADGGGSRHRPWAGDGSAPRGRGKGDRQASVWGPCQQLRFSRAASRGAEGPTGEKGRPG